MGLPCMNRNERGQLPGVLCRCLMTSRNIDALITFGRRHPLSQRFLKRDQPLRGLLEQFVQGADLTADAELEPLREWVAALRLIRIVERETEATGLHASY